MENYLPSHLVSIRVVPSQFTPLQKFSLNTYSCSSQPIPLAFPPAISPVLEFDRTKL